MGLLGIALPQPAPEVFWPEGQPDGVEDTAGEFRAMAGLIAEHAAWLGGPARAVAGPGLWEGLAAGAYLARVERRLPDYEAATAAFALIGQTLSDYAAVLRRLRRQAEGVVEEREVVNRQLRFLGADLAAAEARAVGVDAADPAVERARGQFQARRDQLVGVIDAVGAASARIEREMVAAEAELVRGMRRASDLTRARRGQGAVLGSDSAVEAELLAGLAVAGGVALAAGGVFAAGKEAAAWWAAMSPQQRQAAIALDPAHIGALNGLPAAARNQANRLLLERDLAMMRRKTEVGTLSAAEGEVLANAEAVERQLQDLEGRLDRATGEFFAPQLLVYDPRAFDGDGRAAIVVGDLDTADHVALNVPGLGSTVAGYMENSTSNARELYLASVASAQIAASGQRVASVAWVGYDAPSGFPEWARVASDGMARDGSVLLASDVAGIRDSRGSSQPHLTVVGHSYGSTTTAFAATEHHLAANDIALIGSPGVGDAERATDLGVGRAHVWVGSNSQDAVTWLGTEGVTDPVEVITLGQGGLGRNPADDSFDAQRFQAEAVDRADYPGWPDHSKYYHRQSESLSNLVKIVTGQGGVALAEPRHDPLIGETKDPEASRIPTTPSR